MTKSIISDRAGSSGGILYLPDALKQCPTKRIALYHRCSTLSQAGGKGRPKLEKRRQELVAQLREEYPAKLKHTGFVGVELGQLSEPRPVLEEAAEHARKFKLILVAQDLSRFIRSKAYHRVTNREAVPTAEEFAQLRELVGGVPLATIEPPNISEKGRHKRATNRGNCGRPKTLNEYTAWQILETLGINIDSFEDVNGKVHIKFEASVPNVAKKFGVHKSVIYRLLDSPVPDELIAKYFKDGQSRPWKHVNYPGKIWRKYYLDRERQPVPKR